MNIPSSLTNVAGVAVAPINASATVAAGGSGGASVFSGVIVSDSGLPFELIRVTGDDWQSKVGMPLKPNAGIYAGSLRCMEEALKGGDGYVVRVVPATAKYVSLAVRAKVAEVNATVIAANSYGLPLSLDNGDILKFYIHDGDIKLRSLALTVVTGVDNLYQLQIFATTIAGVEYLEKEWTVSLDRNAVDDYNKSLFITDVLERENAFVRCMADDAFTEPTTVAAIAKTALVGATSGAHADITQADWQKAVKVLKNAMVGYTAVVGLGITEPAVIELLVDVANSRRIDMFGDLAGTSYENAIENITAAAYNYHRLCCYFFPYNTKDPYFGGSFHWGISGIAFTAKALGVMKVEGNVGGYHYSPAGAERGVIPRKSAVPFPNLDTPDYDALYKARINKLGLTKSGLLMIDDAITTHQKEDYLRFQHISSLLDAISREFYALGKELQHEPDGITGPNLQKGMDNICTGYVAAGALVKPRFPDDDGDKEYVITVKQDEIDYWSVKWAVCPTGSSRRIMGQPALIR